ncbi:MAG: YidH family protein [Bacteroidia bacterium]
MGTGIDPRDHLANERTFLAWVRTSVAVMAFGFVVVKFSLFLKQLTFLFGAKINYKGISPIIGILLVVAGILLLFFSFIRFKRVEKLLNTQSFRPQTQITSFLVVTLLLISILLVVYLTLNMTGS